MKKIKFFSNFKEIFDQAIEPENKIYSTIVLVCGFIFAIGLCFVIRPQFEYHGNSGVISWISANKYPKQQEMFYYLGSLIFVPIFTALIWGSWLMCSNMLWSFANMPLRQSLRKAAFTFLPFTLIIRKLHTPSFSETLLPFIILVLAAKLILFIYAFSLTKLRMIKEALLFPGAANLHWSVLVSGVCVGFFILIAYTNETLELLPCLKIILTSAIWLWLLWLISSKALSLIAKRPFDITLGNEAYSYFPLVILLAIIFSFGHRNAILITSLALIVPLKIISIAKPSWLGKTNSTQYHRYIFMYILIPTLIYAFFYSGGNIHGGIDMFHEGERLAPLNSLLRGKIPFRDIYLQHGLFHNAYRPLLASKLFGEPTLAADRMLEHIIDPLRYVVFYIFALQILKSRFFAFISIWVLASGRTSSLARRALSIRYALGIIGLTILIDFVLNKRKKMLYKFHLSPLLAGVLITLNMFYSLEMGLYSLATGFMFLLAASMSFEGNLREKFSPLLSYIAGSFVAFLPFALYFAIHGAIDDMFGNFLIQCRYHIPTWGLKFRPLLPELAKIVSLETLKAFILGENFEWYFPVFVYLITLVHLMYQIFQRKFWDNRNNIVLMLLVIGGIVFFRTPLGRSDTWHLYGTSFAWLICVFAVKGLLAMAWNELRGEPNEIPIAAWRILLVLILVWYVNSIYTPINTIKESFTTLTGYQNIEHDVEPPLRGVGGIKIPADQASQIKQVVEYIQSNTAPDETIFDFSSQGSYYFFADRPMASRYHQICYAATEEMQEEVIRDLEKHKTKLIIYTTGGGMDAIDGVKNVDRHPLIAKYLEEKYPESTKVGNVTFLKRQKEQ